MLTYCLEKLYSDDFLRISISYYVGFLFFFLINRLGKIVFLRVNFSTKIFMKITNQLCKKKHNDLFWQNAKRVSIFLTRCENCFSFFADLIFERTIRYLLLE